MPLAARFYARGDQSSLDQLYWRTVSWIAVLTFPIVATTVLVATPLTELMFGEAYRGAGTALVILSIGLFVGSVLGFNVLVLRVFGQVRLILRGEVVATVMLAALAFALVPPLGTAGGAIALCVSDLLQTAAYQVALRRCGVRSMPAVQLKMFGSLGLACVGIHVAQAVAGAPLLTGLVLVPIASVSVLFFNRDLLDVRSSFPEMMRVPLLRHVLGTNGV